MAPHSSGDRPYRPQLPAAQWEAIAPYVHDVVTRAEPLVIYSARELYPAVTRLALFVKDEYAPLEDDVVFDPYMVGRFVVHHLDGYNRASRNTIRARLRRVSEALLGDAAAGTFKKLGKADAVRPYSLADQASLEGWSRAQTSEERRTSAATLLSLGFGAGLTGAEIIRQRLEDVHVDGDLLTVDVHGQTARSVPVLPDWSAGLHGRRAFMLGSGWAFRADQRGSNVNLITDFVSRTAPPMEIQTRRMRSTWLVHHLDAHTSLKYLLRISGLTSAEALDRVLPYADE
jgi:integrase